MCLQSIRHITFNLDSPAANAVQNKRSQHSWCYHRDHLSVYDQAVARAELILAFGDRSDFGHFDFFLSILDSSRFGSDSYFEEIRWPLYQQLTAAAGGPQSLTFSMALVYAELRAAYPNV
jgi:hypothetical protein